ncbi:MULTISPECIES: alanine racemase [unclassified Nocardioides]|uniref:alanine racemase n=1 Tax=unclassified Nocardioides TaxID=2615069 RepID=UPI0007013262|nr:MULTISPECIES: alanine racemase [unclassified Nocardioides]KQY57407.1 alanine racemase [Nocardioides sp. Root140]KQZ68920.1 alanine racemase [Nocardioides sp. Root151]KRF20403.1 alanine racemase [Nocardioides sp. Soil796]
MGLSLYVDAARFRANQHRILATLPEVVPVAKGNGYGLGNRRLADEARSLGVDTLAIGTYAEVDEVADTFPGSLLVLSPWRAFEAPTEPNPRLIHTIGRVSDLEGLLARDPEARFVLERLTSMVRHGFTPRELREAGDFLRSHEGGARFEGIAFHLPMGGASHLSEVQRLMTDAVAAGLPPTTIWVSHLTAAELAQLARAWPDYTIRPRIGTDLWLGDRGAFTVKATVLDSHHVERGALFGYRGRAAPKTGTILVVSGGTAHGIGLEAPTGANTIKARAGAIARGGLDAAGFVRSPYSIGGKQRLFAEPPHMQASMLFVPQGSAVPDIGDEIDVRVRYTATAFDRVVIA